eukprot:TRINITY_DN21005_c0_g1_i3.p1 TRINITY_DN21005_c0_g1~~TRINITY_DN21005_c0_g1_i3.p1  ORF type:complete len:211 (+),score=57.95 TRINITY_DN21005_c0_g1_i3:82-714(+)
MCIRDSLITSAISALTSFIENNKEKNIEITGFRSRLVQIQNEFSEKWKEYGTYVDYTLNDYEVEINNRAKKLSVIEEKLYKFAMALSPLISRGEEPASKEMLSLQDNARSIIEDILTAGIEYAGNNARSSHKEHLLAKQLYLQEFRYNKEDLGIKEQFQFMGDKFREELLSCCYGNFGKSEGIREEKDANGRAAPTPKRNRENLYHEHSA